MNLCVLLLSAALQAQAPKGDAHPASHPLLIRLPDVQGMLKALDRTPGPRFLASESLQPLLGWAQASGWSAPLPARESLSQALGDPRWSALIPKLSALSLSASGEPGAAQALLRVEMFDAAAAESARELLTTSWNLSAAGSSWTGTGPGTLGQSASLRLEGQRLVIAMGEGSLETLEALGQQPASQALAAGPSLDSRLRGSALEKLPKDSEAAYLWLAHSQDPYTILRELDRSSGCLGGLFAQLPEAELCAPVGMARLEVSPQGYRLDCLEPERAVSAPALDPARLNLVDQRAMLLLAGRLPQAQLLEQLQPLIEFAGLPEGGMRDFEASLRSLLGLLDGEVLLVSNSLNSTSPPKSYLSFGLKPGEDQESKALAACAEFMGALTKFQVSQRDYRVRNKFTKERRSWPVHTLMIPENPNRGLLSPSISPSFVVDGGRLLVSPRAMYLKNELKRRHDGKAQEAEEPGALPARGVELPPGTHQVLLFDWADQVATLINFFPMLTLFLPDLPIDAAGLPSAAEVQRAFPPVLGYSAPFEGGTRHHLRSALGLELLLGLLQLNADWQGSLGDLLPR